MKGDLTFTIIKPNVVKKHKAGTVIQLIEDGGFEIVNMKMVQLSSQQAGEFYKEHEGKVFFDSLIDFMISDKIIVLVLKKVNAVESYRNFIGGATDPSQAKEGSIRQLFGDSVTKNAVHGSDSDLSAKREINFFFKNVE